MERTRYILIHTVQGCVRMAILGLWNSLNCCTANLICKCRTQSRFGERYLHGVFTPALFSSLESNPGVRLGRCEHINHTRVRTETNGLRPCWRGGLGPVPNKLWYGSFVVRTWYSLDPTQLQEESVLNPEFLLDTCPLGYGRSCVLLHCPPYGYPHRLRFERSMVDSWRRKAEEFPR